MTWPSLGFQCSGLPLTNIVMAMPAIASLPQSFDLMNQAARPVQRIIEAIELTGGGLGHFPASGRGGAEHAQRVQPARGGMGKETTAGIAQDVKVAGGKFAHYGYTQLVKDEGPAGIRVALDAKKEIICAGHTGIFL